jgi:hypothetical protein
LVRCEIYVKQYYSKHTVSCKSVIRVFILFTYLSRHQNALSGQLGLQSFCTVSTIQKVHFGGPKAAEKVSSKQPIIMMRVSTISRATLFVSLLLVVLCIVCVSASEHNSVENSENSPLNFVQLDSQNGQEQHRRMGFFDSVVNFAKGAAKSAGKYLSKGKDLAKSALKKGKDLGSKALKKGADVASKKSSSGGGGGMLGGLFGGGSKSPGKKPSGGWMDKAKGLFSSGVNKVKGMFGGGKKPAAAAAAAAAAPKKPAGGGGLFGGVKNMFNTGMNKVKGMFGGAKKPAAAAPKKPAPAGGLFGGVKNMFNTGMNKVKGMFGGAAATAGAGAGAPKKPAAAGGLFGGVKNMFNAGISKVKGMFGGATATAGAGATAGVGALAGTGLVAGPGGAPPLPNPLGGFVNNIKNRVTGAINQGATAVQNWVGNAANRVQGAVNQVSGAINHGVQRVQHTINGGIQGAQDAWNNFTGQTPAAGAQAPAGATWQQPATGLGAGNAQIAPAGGAPMAPVAAPMAPAGGAPMAPAAAPMAPAGLQAAPMAPAGASYSAAPSASGLGSGNSDYVDRSIAPGASVDGTGASVPASDLPTAAGTQNPGFQYDSATSCTGGPSAGATKLLNYLKSTFQGRSMGVYNCRNVRGGKSKSLHSEGRAIDWGLNANNAATLAEGNKIRDWLVGNGAANAKNMGVQEVIWNRQIWSSSKAAQGMRSYGGTNPHTDHLHIGMNRWGASNFDPSILQSDTTTGAAAPDATGAVPATGAAPTQ